MATSNKTKKLQLLGGGFATKKQLDEQHIKTYTLKEGETIDDAPDWAEEVIDPFSESEGGSGVTREEFKRLSETIADKLDADKLPEAVNYALAQAKASGEFDGEDGSDYVLTEDDKNEIAEIAAGMIDTTLLNIIGSGVVA